MARNSRRKVAPPFAFRITNVPPMHHRIAWWLYVSVLWLSVAVIFVALYVTWQMTGTYTLSFPPSPFCVIQVNSKQVALFYVGLPLSNSQTPQAANSLPMVEEFRSLYRDLGHSEACVKVLQNQLDQAEHANENSATTTGEIVLELRSREAKRAFEEILLKNSVPYTANALFSHAANRAAMGCFLSLRFEGGFVGLVQIPMPVFILPCLLLVLFHVATRGRRCYRHRVRNGLCTNCGYCLSGLVSGVCPECGTVIPDEQCARLGLATGTKSNAKVDADTGGNDRAGVASSAAVAPSTATDPPTSIT